MICEDVTGLKLTDVKAFGDNGPRIAKCRNVVLTRCKSDHMTGYGWYFGGAAVPIDAATKKPSRKLADQPWNDGITIIDGEFGPTDGQYSLRFERAKNVRIIGGKAWSPMTGKGMCVGLRCIMGFTAEDFEIDPLTPQQQAAKLGAEIKALVPGMPAAAVAKVDQLVGMAKG
jgi:hypothetical protein